jgi:UDP-N-acetylmuramate dehydrogenase
MDRAFLQNCRGIIKFNYNLAELTWLKVGGPADIFYKPHDLQDLQYFLQNLPKQYDLNIIGAGSNVLIRDAGIRGTVIKLGSNFNYITQEEDEFLTVGATTLNYNLAHFCYQNSIQGFEFLVGIPGTIGGGIAMNAGAYGKEFKDIIQEITAIKRDGSILKLSIADIGFKYRGNSLQEQLIFVAAKFSFTKGDQEQIKNLMDAINLGRKNTQPINAKTAGSLFANPLSQRSWQLIDKVGMRGYTLNRAQISPMHCNFLINLGGATASDLEALGNMVKQKVQKELGVELHWEVRKMGQKN